MKVGFPLHEHTTWEIRSRLSVERITRCLVDFTDDRPRLWSETSHPDTYRVHEVGPTWAEVTEGLPFAWSRERYDWSEPGIVRLDQLDSNIAVPGGAIVYRLDAEGAGTRIRCDRRRTFRPTIAGRLAATYLRLFGRRILRRQFAAGLARIRD